MGRFVLWALWLMVLAAVGFLGTLFFLRGREHAAARRRLFKNDETAADADARGWKPGQPTPEPAPCGEASYKFQVTSDKFADVHASPAFFPREHLRAIYSEAKFGEWVDRALEGEIPLFDLTMMEGVLSRARRAAYRKRAEACRALDPQGMRFREVAKNLTTFRPDAVVERKP